jgi:hypothetical protein
MQLLLALLWAVSITIFPLLCLSLHIIPAVPAAAIPLLLLLQADQWGTCHRRDCCLLGTSSASWRHGQLSTTSSTSQAAVHSGL